MQLLPLDLTPVCMQVHPATAGEVLSGILDMYSGDATAAARSGAALALATCAEHILTEDVPKALDFLLGQALADVLDAVRSQMVDAGAQCCESDMANHGIAELRAAHCLKTLRCMQVTPLHALSALLPGQSVSHCAAGIALVSAHGGSKNKDAMLQLFEGYLERKVLQDIGEEAYDRVREGAVIFLGTLARHLEPSGPKVCAFRRYMCAA